MQTPWRYYPIFDRLSANSTNKLWFKNYFRCC